MLSLPGKGCNVAVKKEGKTLKENTLLIMEIKPFVYILLNFSYIAQGYNQI